MWPMGEMDSKFVLSTYYLLPLHESIFASGRMNLWVFTNLPLGLDRKHVAHVCDMFTTRVRDLSHTCERCYS
jgi:hypothetical protein